ncbi:Rieske (2Fe-2S) protein [Pseudonocardiaceae bacterium YIM PH 21723]|nr:Rieske (2Fe-2S) protein [Pseudonocardiaceae bacterium YIM PH 21723]
MSDHENKELTAEELEELSPAEKLKLATALDGVELVEYHDRWPVEGTRAEKRAERQVAAWFLLSVVTGIAFIGVFLFWPWEYQPANHEGGGQLLYRLYTPLLGLTLGLSVLGIGVGVIAYAKKFLPSETAIQQRHDGGSTEQDKQTFVALLKDTGDRSTIARRPLIYRTLGAGAGVMGLGLGVFSLGGLVRDPWKKRDKADMWTTGWAPNKPGEVVYFRRDTGNPHEVVLVRPEDIEPGGFETCFPFRESERENHEALLKALRRSDNPVMLIRIRPGQKVVKRDKQEDFNFGDLYAYSKICTHLGCPTSLFEQQTGKLLCPCHQSQFDLFTYAKPIFGPATRALPQLPITVNSEGYVVARSDFIEPVGPSFWERKS